ncbi:hypothetical protein BaRGS_00026878 [Batillaria attramentaria]|uniref:RNA ligase 1 n=1 Tax=Batillaria attramentaria TaxID=370345 RepID=A0ABD0K369_9CAEN
MSLFVVNRFTGEDPQDSQLSAQDRLEKLKSEIALRKQQRLEKKNVESPPKETQLSETLPRKKQKIGKNGVSKDAPLPKESEKVKRKKHRTGNSTPFSPKAYDKSLSSKGQTTDEKCVSDDVDSDSEHESADKDEPTAVEDNRLQAREESKGSDDADEGDPDAVGGFSVLGNFENAALKPVKRVLPDWLAHPSIIQADLKRRKCAAPGDQEGDPDMKILDEELQKRLHENGIHSFFPVQRQVVPVLMKDLKCGIFGGQCGMRPRDICVSAPTGSGKTLAFVLPVIQALRKRVVPHVRAVVILPVRDLAEQVFTVFRQYCAGTSLKVGLVVGRKTLAVEQATLVKKREGLYHSLVDILVATPGRLVDHINSTPGFDLSHLRFLVVDEADRMMEDIKQDWLVTVETAAFTAAPLAYFPLSRTPPGPLTIASAQCSQLPVKKGEIQAAGGFVGKYTTPEGLTEYFVECSAAEKPLVVLHFLHNLKFRQVLCFTNSVESTHRLYLLAKLFGGIKVCEFSSRQQGERRKKIIRQFANGKVDLLVCSDAMARGMDVENVKCVISYDNPPYIKTYIHRVGRTARAGKAGTSISLLEKKEIFHFKQMMRDAGKWPRIREMKVGRQALRPLVEPFQAALRQLPDILKNEPSKKRANQQFKVTATDVLNPEVVTSDIEHAVATEKVDGTCCLIDIYQGQPWMWARLDRKPNKAGDKKFQRYQTQLRAWRESGETGEPPTLQWDVHKDFKEVPENWIPASGIKVVDGVPQPDNIGHTPGWVPVERKSRQYCWHLASVDLDQGFGLVLRANEDNSGLLIECTPLSQLCRKTCELIGTNVNGNPYGIGSKQEPAHFLVAHGSLPVICPSPVNGPALREWFEVDEEDGSSRVEGIVWHCPSGMLFKLHRNHLNLSWPVRNPQLSQRPVRISVDSAKYSIDMDTKSQFSVLAAVHDQAAEKLCELDSLYAGER